MARHADPRQREEVFAFCEAHPEKSLAEVCAHFQKKYPGIQRMWVLRNSRRMRAAAQVVAGPPAALAIPPGHCDTEVLVLTECVRKGQELLHALGKEEREFDRKYKNLVSAIVAATQQLDALRKEVAPPPVQVEVTRELTPEELEALAYG